MRDLEEKNWGKKWELWEKKFGKFINVMEQEVQNLTKKKLPRSWEKQWIECQDWSQEDLGSSAASGTH